MAQTYVPGSQTYLEMASGICAPEPSYTTFGSDALPSDAVMSLVEFSDHLD